MRIRIRRSFSLYIFILSCISGIQKCVCLLAALLIHEGCHLIVAKILNEPIESVDLAPFGGVMRYIPGATASKGVRGMLLALAGPVGNYVLILLSCVMAAHHTSEIWGDVLKANLSMMFLNLLPALPFDGGMALFCLGYYLFDVSVLIGILCLTGTIIGILFCVLSFVGVMMYAKLNLSLVVVGIYVFCYALASKDDLLAQNAYVIMSERAHRRHRPEKMLLYKVYGEERLYSLIPYMYRSNAAAFLVETAYGRSAIIGDITLSHAIMKTPHASILDLLEKTEKNQ